MSLQHLTMHYKMLAFCALYSAGLYKTYITNLNYIIDNILIVEKCAAVF